MYRACKTAETSVAVGDILVSVNSYATSGDGPYGTTSVEFCRVVKVTPKQVLVVRVKTKVIKYIPDELDGKVWIDSFREFMPLEAAEESDSEGERVRTGRIYRDENPESDKFLVSVGRGWTGRSFTPWDGKPVVGNQG